MIKIIAVLGISLCASLYGLYWQVQQSGKLKGEISQQKATVEAQRVSFKFTDGVMSSQKEIVENAQNQSDQHNVNSSAADDSADRLRDQIDTYIRQSADDRAGFAEYRKTTEAKLRVLADMHRESDRLAGVYAYQADKNRIAGETCQRSYDSLVENIRKTYGVR